VAALERASRRVAVVEEAMQLFSDDFQDGVCIDGGPADEALSVVTVSPASLLSTGFALYAVHIQAVRLF
jgi:hypothetical protein